MSEVTIREIVIDVPRDRGEDAFRFYQGLTGFSGTFDPDNMNPLLESEYGPDLGLQRVEGFMAPTWPTQERGQQIHLDYVTNDKEAATRHAERLGATRVDPQPDEQYVVMRDPFGHPFCFVDPYADRWKDVLADDESFPVIRLATVLLDCGDQRALWAFYTELLAPTYQEERENYSRIALAEGIDMTFQQVDDFVSPTWPTQVRGQQFHMDLRVSDTQATRDRVLKLGGSELYRDPEYPGWIVLADPAGHPFCINSEL